ncbi:bifunctional proline dehydrogenase/L-glutamate gamma-semialdehyde dehydrogenase PutA [uncultured Paraglaciecola sp.]|uniref:bifunctional proline dehydrogenase/L-glutamate gamma-semialdehyde dehydrogenase PutA n=1 Tax=uncultured Paraglaciecola sp. TaxID=1765024 RepID=UPI0030DCE2C7
MLQHKLQSIRQAIRTNTYLDEAQSVEYMLNINPVSEDAQNSVHATALLFVQQCRANPDKQGLFAAFLQEYSLSSQEGVVLMCLAEALLRVPDRDTVDCLIAEKIHMGQWESHIGNSAEILVNAASVGLSITRKILANQQGIEIESKNWFAKLIQRLGEPVVRGATLQAMKFMGQQYVLGRDIKEASKRGRRGNVDGTRFSFDMLGEGARTYETGAKYYASYLSAIRSIGKGNHEKNVYAVDGISVKLSALHPRYEFSRHQLVMDELLPDVLALAVEAKKFNIGFTIDAEEAARLDIELDVFACLAFAPELAGWNGLGFVLQAYQKRALSVVDWLVELAKSSDRKLMVRLVKGAYWDAEIKHAQEMGFGEFTVFTRKAHTDLSYQVCAGKLLDNRDVIYPQFATHNAYTVALIMEMAGNDMSSFEFQRLHGMGDLLYTQVSEIIGHALPLRVYAPVGVHRDLLPYLVRRLLENGANGSFVNQFLDGQIPPANIVQSVESTIEKAKGKRNTQIPLAQDIFNAFGEKRNNSRGIDVDDPLALDALLQKVKSFAQTTWQAGPIINGLMLNDNAYPLYSPADTTYVVGHCSDAKPLDVEIAMTSAFAAQPDWQALPVEQRATIMEGVADLLEAQMEELTTLISFEAGRTLNDGISEVREAVDFCRYYALQIRDLVSDSPLQPKLTQGQGVFVCISPWNFPLAIFVGQIAAALVAGNAVIAKPAEQSPLIATEAIKLMHQAGVPPSVLQLLTGSGRELGPLLMADKRVAGVAFTGSTNTAQSIQSELIKRGSVLPPFIAETGGQNVMLVDSTALPEQVVDDVIQSAFLSAGQRCSALRVLYVQHDIADGLLNMLKGALDTLKLGRPWELSTDIGPVIDEKALVNLQGHCIKMTKEAKFVARGKVPEDGHGGYFMQPHIFEIEHINQLEREVFGPVLHVIRYDTKDLEQVFQDINDTGYGLTLGVHSRLKAFADKVYANTHVGNTYINRNMVGAVVGVNPFGGQGLSGTGFKAGGPHYLLRFTKLWPAESVIGVANDVSNVNKTSQMSLRVAKAGQGNWQSKGITKRIKLLESAFAAGQNLVEFSHLSADVQNQASRMFAQAQHNFATAIQLPGPTGEKNELSLNGRGIFLAVLKEGDEIQNLLQAMGALLAGNTLLLLNISTQKASDSAVYKALQSFVPVDCLQCIDDAEELHAILTDDALGGVTGSNADGLISALGSRRGAIIPFVGNVSTEYTLLRYASEKTKTDNIVATGGNAMLLNLKE